MTKKQKYSDGLMIKLYAIHKAFNSHENLDENILLDNNYCVTKIDLFQNKNS